MYLHFHRRGGWLGRLLTGTSIAASLQAGPCCLAGLRLVDFRLQLIGDVLLILPGDGDKLGVAPSSDDLVILVHEFDRGVCECLANCLVTYQSDKK